VDDAQQRAALRSWLDPEGDGAVRERGALLAHPVADLDAGNGGDRLGLGEVGLRQPSLAEGGKRDGAPDLFRLGVELDLERDFGFVFRFVAGIARRVAHWSMSFRSALRSSMRRGQ